MTYSCILKAFKCVGHDSFTTCEMMIFFSYQVTSRHIRWLIHICIHTLSHTHIFTRAYLSLSLPTPIHTHSHAHTFTRVNVSLSLPTPAHTPTHPHTHALTRTHNRSCTPVRCSVLQYVAARCSVLHKLLANRMYSVCFSVLQPHTHTLTRTRIHPSTCTSPSLFFFLSLTHTLSLSLSLFLAHTHSLVHRDIRVLHKLLVNRM